MIEAEFKLDGEPLFAEITSGFAQPGSYRLLLWESGVNQIAFDKPGNFLNSDDDKYALPGNTAAQNGRILDAIVTLRITPPIDSYRTELIVYQGNRVLGRDRIEAKSSAITVSTELFILLKGV